MPIFEYKARKEDGTLVTGEYEAKTEKEVKLYLSEQGLLPISASTTTASFKIPSFFRSKKKAKFKDLIGFTRQFATMFRAGVPVNTILITLTKQIRNDDLQEHVYQIYEDVSGGTSLMDAFNKHPGYFDELYVNMINVGEQGGVLDQTLTTLVDILKRDYRILNSVKSATLYPKIVLVTFIAVVTLLMMFVMPGFADFYANFNAELPLPTRIMMGISDFFVRYWYVMLAILVVIVVVYKKYTATPRGAFQLDILKLIMPVFGNLNLMVANARFGHLLVSLYKSGLPLSKSLTIVGNTIGNLAYKKEIMAMRDDLESGTSLSDSMRHTKYFTPLMVESAAVGEKTGALDDVLESTAEFYDEEVSDILEQLTTLIEPILLFGLFGMIALLAFAVFLPIWKTTELILPALK